MFGSMWTVLFKSRSNPREDSCEHGNELPSYIKGESTCMMRVKIIGVSESSRVFGGSLVVRDCLVVCCSALCLYRYPPIL
jgi:hypothetical protein